MKSVLRHLLAAFPFALGLIAVTPSAYAIPIVWTLGGVTLADGATASGQFTYDATTDDYSAWSIFVSANAGRPDYTYLPGLDGGFLGIHSATMVDFVAFPAVPASGRFVRLTFDAALTDAGGLSSITALGGVSWDCSNCSDLNPIVSGFVTSEAVPEPGTCLLLLAGLGSIGYTARRRKQRAA